MHWSDRLIEKERAMRPYDIGGVALLAIIVYVGVRLLPEIRRYIKISRM